ncbi:MAG TPA: beta-xylosidase [Terriglobales bacterium]|nr:beta-xylosidase [Terriglobales bacterium]
MPVEKVDGHGSRMTTLRCKSILAIGSVLAFLLLPSWIHSQESPHSVSVDVRFDQPEGTISPIWNYFGYDEPNYSYAPNGRKLLGELAALSSGPAYVRVHNLLTTGDGSASLKWGSTNVYTEDAQGKAIYNWTILDRIFDAFRSAGVKPLVEIGFMPEALSTHPQPYRHNFPEGSIFTGWAYPPRDYQKWSEVVFQFVHHLRQRYGDAEVKTWLWEVWNEPDIDYWKGTPQEYFKLYDFTADAVLRALPEARIGGPDSTGPGNAKAAEFLRSFLDHCARQPNYVTGKVGSRLDFISFHPKGSPKWQGDHVQMGIARQLAAIEQGFQIVASFPEWRSTPIILGESDPEGCAACSARNNPQNSYRNGPLYAAYTAETLNDVLFLAGREHVNFIGAVTWAFEFEGQPYFEGFRTLATNGVDKPVLNAFRMLGLLGNERVNATSSGALRSEDVVRDGVRAQPDIGVIAARRDHEVEVLIWNYHDDDLPAAATPIDLAVNGLPSKVSRVLLEHFRIDSSYSNSFTAWKEMGSPQSPTQGQYEQLQSAGQLQMLGSPSWMPIAQGAARLQFALPRQGLSLVRLSWE